MSTYMLKSALAVIIGIGAVILAAIRSRNARARLERINSGQICLHCDSGDVASEAGGLRCNACGQVTSAALLQADAGPEDLGDLFRHDGNNDLF